MYDYFAPDEMKFIVRKLPQSDLRDDSVDFARQLCERFDSQVDEKKYAVIVTIRKARRKQLP